jgi:hypothetical protein
MSISSSTKSLAEDIETSYKARMAAVSDNARETHQILENFKREREEMAASLRHQLSSSERERRQRFATFQRSLREEIGSMVTNRSAERRQIHAY